MAPFSDRFILFGKGSSDLEDEFGCLGPAIVERDETSPGVPFIEKQQTRRYREAEEDLPE